MSIIVSRGQCSSTGANSRQRVDVTPTQVHITMDLFIKQLCPTTQELTNGINIIETSQTSRCAL